MGADEEACGSLVSQHLVVTLKTLLSQQSKQLGRKAGQYVWESKNKLEPMRENRNPGGKTKTYICLWLLPITMMSVACRRGKCPSRGATHSQNSDLRQPEVGDPVAAENFWTWLLPHAEKVSWWLRAAASAWYLSLASKIVAASLLPYKSHANFSFSKP